MPAIAGRHSLLPINIGVDMKWSDIKKKFDELWVNLASGIVKGMTIGQGGSIKDDVKGEWNKVQKIETEKGVEKNAEAKGGDSGEHKR